MALTEREREYLKKLKSEGKTKEQATALLQAVREKLGQPSTTPPQQTGPSLPASEAKTRGIGTEKQVGPVLPDNIAQMRGITQQPTGETAGKTAVMREELTNPELADKQASEFWRGVLPEPIAKAAEGFKDYVSEPVSKGVTKGVAGIGETAVNLADKGAEAVGTDLVSPETQRKMKEFTTPETTGQAVVKTVTQGLIGGGAGAKLGAKLSSPIVNFLGGGGKTAQILGKIINYGSRSLGSTSGVTGVSEGRLPSYKEAGLGLLIDGVMLGASRLIDPKRLIGKATGIPPAQKAKLDTAVSRLKDSSGKPIYKDIDDFVLKNNLAPAGASRSEMVENAKTLFDKADESKTEILKAIKQKAPNVYDELFEYLLKSYDTPGNKDVIEEITKLSKQRTLSAEQLDYIRKLADDTWEMGASNAKTKGVQKMIKPIRDMLAKLDKSGQLALDNLHKSLLSELGSTSESLTKSLSQSANKSVFGSSMFRGATTGGAGYALSGLPVIGPLSAKAAAVLGGMEILTSVPQVATLIAAMNKGGSAGRIAQEQLAPVLKAIIKDYSKGNESQ